jgi:tetratricopeptide (TPR) repeat protein
MDVARDLTAKMQERAALRYVRIAVALAPQSRFVIRAAARYFLHIGEHDRAHEILRRSPILRSDPWVQASEIAVATVRGKNSDLLRSALRTLKGQVQIGVDQSELASAVGTVELNEGSSKSARTLFQQSLSSPNDNSLVQAEWAATRLKLAIDSTALSLPLSFEANSNNAYRRLLIPDAIKHAKNWSEDEPYASRPLGALCYLYCLDGRFVEAEAAVESAIRAEGKPSTSSLLNKIFVRTELGKLDGAEAELLQVASRPDAKDHAVHILANAGAIAYSNGASENGRDFYLRAIKVARSRGSVSEEALARAYFARAALLHGDPKAAEIVKEAEEGVRLLPSPGAIHIVSRLVGDKERRALEAVADNRVAKVRWAWDALSNTLGLLE